ncbi:DUF2285 domain-containing protein [Roseibium sp.]|uniref:DUF2285 domain-containing protein n=1 Tax=Roseibium sp. TaxID=1936156 RepID=UPI003297FAE6
MNNSPALAWKLPGKCNHSPPGEWPVRGASNFLFDPCLPAAHSPAIWRHEDNPGVVVVQAHDGDALLEATLGRRKIIAEAQTGRGRHLVIAGPRARHRVLVAQCAVPSPAGYLVAADGPLELRLAALSAFLAHPSRSKAVRARAALKPTAYQAYRLQLLLAILDRLDQPSGAQPTMRQIASDLIYPDTSGGRAIDWKTSSDRRHTQRLVAEARRMRDAGFRALLMPASSSFSSNTDR